MTDTILSSPTTTEQFKVAILELIQENNPQFTQWLKTALGDTPPLTVKKRNTKNKHSETELPFWKAHPNWQPLDPTPFTITEENLKKVQEEWADAPNAEVIIAFLTK
jgi:hypothetical protein